MAIDEGSVYVVNKVKKMIKRDGVNITGLPPDNMLSFTAKAGDGKVTLDWKARKETVVDSQVLCTCKSVKIVRKEGSAPENIDDGTVVTAAGDVEGTYTDTGLTNDTTYFYRAFPMSDHGVYNLSGESVARAMPKDYHLYAFHYSESDSSPASVTYPADCDNANFTPFSMNLSTGVPNYGSWSMEDEATRWLFPRSCMLKYEGVVDYYLDENDETKKEDGTASDVANASYGGNAMMEWGRDGKKIWWKVVPDADGKGFTFYVCDKKLDDTFDAWNFYNCKGEYASHYYTPKYPGSLQDGKLRSLSGGTNYVNNTRQTEISLALANNLTSDPIWYTEVSVDWLFSYFLHILMSKSTSTQAVYGSGRCDSNNSSAIGQGTMNGKGMFYGKSGQTEGVKTFGRENPWGNLWMAVAGLMYVNNVIKLKLTYGQQDGSTVDGYNLTGEGYKAIGTITGTSGGYTNHVHMGENFILPATVSGSESTYYADGCWLASGTMYARVGGAWSTAGRDGGFCVNLSNTASFVYTSIGAAVSCKPLA